VYVRVWLKSELSDADLKLLFSGHLDVFTEVRDKMSLGSTEVKLTQWIIVLTYIIQLSNIAFRIACGIIYKFSYI